MAFEPVTPTDSSAKAASEVQAPADKTKSNDALPFGGKSIKSFEYKPSSIFQLVVASVSNNNALSFGDKSTTASKLVVASVKNEDSNGQTNDSPAKQCPVPKDDPAIMMATHAKLRLQLIVASIQARSTISIQEKISVVFHSEEELDSCKLIVDFIPVRLRCCSRLYFLLLLLSSPS